MSEFQGCGPPSTTRGSNPDCDSRHSLTQKWAGLTRSAASKPLHEPLTRPLLLLKLDEQLRQVGAVIADVQPADRPSSNLTR
jgi:hypothetical protein